MKDDDFSREDFERVLASHCSKFERKKRTKKKELPFVGYRVKMEGKKWDIYPVYSIQTARYLDAFYFCIARRNGIWHTGNFCPYEGEFFYPCKEDEEKANIAAE